MRIDYHDIYNQQFEKLTVSICKVLLGPSTQSFSTGPDGGRDAKFFGTASKFPNIEHPFAGRFIIQAKHTDNPVAKMSDKDFYSDENNKCIIMKEVMRVKKLINSGEVDHYLFFTNRRDSANKIAKIEKEFNSLGLKSATVYGIKNMDMFLKQYPQILDLADLDQYGEPLRLIPDDLAEIILSLKKEIKNFEPDQAIVQSFKRVPFEKKCKKNNLTNNTRDFILSNYLKEFYKIDEFLANPSNEDLQEIYMVTAEEFNAEILERLRPNIIMDAVLNKLLYRLFYRDGDLNRNKRLTRTVIYYMYWKCDIGLKIDVNS